MKKFEIYVRNKEEVTKEEYIKYHQERISYRLEEIDKINKSAEKKIVKLKKEIAEIVAKIEAAVKPE